VSNDTCGAGSGAMRRFAGERGIATPVAIAVMSVVMLLAAGGALAALGTNESANDDRRAKRALAAAEAGIQQAAYRLATLRPDRTKCLGAGPTIWAVDPDLATGECTTQVPGTIAPGAGFSYVVTPELSGTGCADQGNVPPDMTSSDHCITATGTVGSITRRLQARVRVARGGIFSGIGLVGLDSVTIQNSGEVWSDIGSNGLISGGNSTEIDGVLKIPNTAPSPTINGAHNGVVRQPNRWELAPTDFAAIAAGPNNNATLSGWTTSWNSTTREAVLDGKKYTLPAGTYLMCEFFADQSVDIDLTGASASNPVRIFIDSPDRPGSGCPAGTGRFCLDNSIKFNRPGNAAALQIYVHGTTAVCASGRPGMPFQASSYRTDMPIVLNNSVDFNGSIYAPTTDVRLNNSIQMEGGIVARRVHFENSIDFWHADELADQVAGPGPVRRVSWVECRPQPTTPSDPESGCA
jgi:type II secretory pathway pseudopilin PulG